MALPRVALWTTVLMCSAALPTAPAFHPFDDDAGSGGDAGDAAAMALPIQPGEHAGRFSTPHDTHDYYSFQAEEGQQVELSAQSASSMRLVLVRPEPLLEGGARETMNGMVEAGSSNFFLVPSSGTWLLHAELDVPRSSLEYRFGLFLSSPRALVAVESVSGWIAFEARLLEPTRFSLVVQVVFPAELGDAGSFGTLVEHGVHELAPGGSWAHYGTYGAGRTVSAQGNDLATLPIRIGTDASQGYYFEHQSGHLDAGLFRVAAYTTYPTALLRAYLLADAPFDHRAAQGADVVRWSDADAQSDLKVLAPGASAVGERTYDLGIGEGERFVGAFRSWGFDAAVHDPNGDLACEGSGCGIYRFLSAGAGAWRIRLGTTFGAGATGTFGAEKVYLDGARVPLLGLAGSAGPA